MKRTILTFVLLIFFSSCNKRSNTNKEEYDKAYDYLSKSKSDSAFKYFNRAKDNFIENKNFSLAGSCLVNMAIIQCNSGDFYGSRDSGLNAIKYLNKKNDSVEIVSNFNNLGIASQHLKDYIKAAEFYDAAAEFATAESKITLLNNKAASFIHIKKYDSAISILQKLSTSPYIKSDTLYSKIFDNLAYAKFLKDPSFNSEPELYKAFQMRNKIKDYDGLNASLFHLTKYFENRNRSKALFYAQENLRIAKHNNSPDDQLKAIENIILLDNTGNVKNFFLKYRTIDDSLVTIRSKAKTQFALERFDAEKFRRESTEKSNNILKLCIGIAVLIIIIIFIVVRYRKRQLKLKQEKELEVKNTQLRLSKKVHDVVANGIYQVMTKIENQEHFDRDTALDELEFVYEKSRDISYDKADEEQEFSKKISELIASFNNDTVKTFTAGNNPALWENISPPVKDEVFQIIRELMVNMKKHSQASHVALRFEKTETSVEIQYKDNGIGIPGDLIYKNGLRNAESRMAAIGGAIIFDTEIEKGLKVNLSVPAS
ncbi:ATP-binding protein [uncultured Chryseobacterium sp.]|uniref:tetratricopeptide repeat-containing sensor histidine kinase n=1 Tax=uncultured Chryseobacterium sp. TaxID=259322 RepID=UPI0025EA6439|nr:ATP-binding protein [uncultured Chryseobacterium sp.]